MRDVEIKIIDKELYSELSSDPSRMLPAFQSAGACAVDLRSSETRSFVSGECYQMKAGLAIYTGGYLRAPEAGSEHSNPASTVATIIIPRSGMGSKGLVIGNLVGLIDEDYQGELQLSVWNRSANTISVKRGERIAQMLFFLALRPSFRVVEEFSRSTARGEGGHGSTGKV